MALATGYRELEYIQKSSSGSEYIDTGFRPKNTSRVTMEFDIPQNPDASDYIGIFGGRTGNGSASFTFWQQQGTKFRSDFASVNSSLTPDKNYGHFTVDKDKKVTKLTDMVTSKSWSTSVTTSTTFTANCNLTLFALNSNNSRDSRDANNMKLYSCQIYDNGTLVRDFVPCRRTSDNVAGLWDRVNSEFYGPSGSGSFIAGPDLVNFNAKAKIAGDWKELVNGYVKINGVWKEITGVEARAGSWKA